MNTPFSGYDSNWCFLLRIFFSSNSPILGYMVLWYMFNKIALSLCFSLFLGLLTACDPNTVLHLKKSESPSSETPSENMKIGGPVALPPSFEGKPVNIPAKTPNALVNGLPALKPMKGVNIDALFSENIKDTTKRFSRVENAVIDLHKEFDTYKPAIVRLSAVEADIQNLVKELEVLLQETPADQHQPMNLTQNSEPTLQVEQLDPNPTPPPSVEDRPDPVKIVQATAAPPPHKEEKPPPPHTPPKTPLKHFDGIVAQNLRVGEHADKIRIVLDANQKTDFKIDLDNDEKLIIVELRHARWVGDMTHKYSSTSLLDSYNVEPINNNKGSMIVISLKRATSIMQKSQLTPDASSSYHRIYFDLKP